MTIRNIGPNSTYATIADAMGAAIGGDTLQLEPGYGDEAALVTVQNLTVTGEDSSRHVDLTLGAGIGDLTLGGEAGFRVNDNSGANTITGNEGRNIISVSGGADVVHGGGGTDRLIVDYASATATVTATVTGVTDGGANSVTFDGVERLTLLTGAGNDTITTSDGNSIVMSADGNDTITVGDGRNFISAGIGNDTVTTGDGGNKVDGGAGDNTITTGEGVDRVRTGGGNDTIMTGGEADRVQVRGGQDTLDAGAGADRLIVSYGDSVANVTGGVTGGTLAAGYAGVIADADGDLVNFSNVESFSVTTGKGNDNLTTGGGGDMLSGGGGQDRFDAGAGADALFGGGGADTLIGGLDADVLTGGSGVDTFLFTALADSRTDGMDLLADLRGDDVIDLSQIDADATQAGDQAFVLVDDFSGTAGEARFFHYGVTGRTYLSLDVDGDGAADARIAIEGDRAEFDNFVL